MLWNVRHLEQQKICVENYNKDVWRAFIDKLIEQIYLQVEGEIWM